MTMKKDERMAALNELARRNPHIKPIGGSWPNPFDGKTHRWTNADLEKLLYLLHHQKRARRRNFPRVLGRDREHE